MKLHPSTALLLALMLGSCGGIGLTPNQRDQVTDIAGDAAGDAVADDDGVRALRSRVEDLDSRVQEVESRLGM